MLLGEFGFLARQDVVALGVEAVFSGVAGMIGLCRLRYGSGEWELSLNRSTNRHQLPFGGLKGVKVLHCGAERSGDAGEVV